MYFPRCNVARDGDYSLKVIGNRLLFEKIMIITWRLLVFESVITFIKYFYIIFSKKIWKFSKICDVAMFRILILKIFKWRIFNKQSATQVNQNRDFLRVGHFTISFKLSESQKSWHHFNRLCIRRLTHPFPMFNSFYFGRY